MLFALLGPSWLQLYFLNNQMSSQTEMTGVQSKKAAFHLAKFQYHMQNTIPDLFPGNMDSTPKIQEKILRTKKGERNMIFHYASQVVDGVSTIDAQSILESAHKLYATADSIRINENSFKKNKSYKLPYLPIYGHFHQIIQFQLIDKNQSSQIKPNKKKGISTSKVRMIKDDLGTANQSRIKSNNKNYQLYVIHHCQSSQKQDEKTMRWQNFTQKYHFIDETINDEVKPKIYYYLILNYREEEGGIFNYLNSQSKLIESFVADYLAHDKGVLQNLDKIQGYLLLSKDRVDKKLKELHDPSFQQVHKRWLKLPSQYYKQFMTLKKHTLANYKSIHEQNASQPRHSQQTLSNLICRYMHAKQYNYKQTLQSLLQYLKWQKQLSETYTLLSFEKFHKRDLFTYLGQDFEGRTVILNRASNLKLSTLTQSDIEGYSYYFIYFLQVWLPKKFKGYTDQYSVIADIEGLGSDNFKLSLSKKNVSDGLKYAPQRQYKLFAVNLASFAYVVWSFLKPLLPKRTLSKISVLGADRAEIIEILTKQMDITVIPQYLGGKNTRIYSDDLNQEAEQLKRLANNPTNMVKE